MIIYLKKKNNLIKVDTIFKKIILYIYFDLIIYKKFNFVLKSDLYILNINSIFYI